VLDLKLDRAKTVPKDAATIVLVRDAAGLELFCVERSKQSRFLGGAIVFPGGKLDVADALEDWASRTTAPYAPSPSRASSTPFATDEAHLRALAVAACRETLEEAAMLHVHRSLRSRFAPTDQELLALRERMKTEPAALRSFLSERSLLLDLGALHPLSRWVTPEAESRRYDARFFVAVAPPDQAGTHDDHETTASFWASPEEILRRWEAGEVQVAPPTHRTLMLLASCKTTQDVLALADASCLDPICPRLVRQTTDTLETLALALPGDPEHEVQARRIDGPSRYVLRGDRWLAEDAPR
jgi:8-oxo-dGTP pyrophosphatase MutT (NUDIX family)